MMKRIISALCILAAILFTAPAHAQKPIFLVPGGTSGPPTSNTVALGAGLSFASLPSAFVPANATLQFGGPFSFSFGLQTTALGVNAFTVFFQSQTGVGGMAIYDNAGLERWRVDPGDGVCYINNNSICASRSLVNDGNRHIITGTFDAGAIQNIYVDGGLIDTRPSGPYTPATLYSFFSQTNTALTMFDLRLLNCALTPSQVLLQAQLFAIGLRPTTGNALNSCLVAEWPMSAGTYTLPSGTTSGSITDIINGNNGILDSTPPTVAVTVPANGATGLTGSVTVTATASDNTLVTQVKLLVDGVLRATLSSGPYTTTWDSTLYVDGPHTFQAIATDFAGNTTTSATVTASTANGIAANTQLHFDTTGSDASPTCSLAAPCQTIAHLNTLRLYPTWSVLFQGGQSFTGCIHVDPTQAPSLGLAAQPIIFDSYGTGTATILANCSGTGATNGVAYLDAVSGLKMQNLSINGNAAGSNTIAFGVVVENTSTTIMDTVTLTNLDITGFQTGTTTISSAGIFAVGFSSNGLCTRITNINITNNTIHGHTNSPTDPETNGYQGYACINPGPPVNSSLENMTLTGNILANLGGMTVFPNVGNGLVPNGVFGVLMQFNLAHDIAGNQTTSCGGGAGLWVNNSDSTVNQFSEVYNVQASPTRPSPNGCDWGAAEFDNGVTNSIIQYFYAHHNAGPGFFGTTNGLDARGWGNNTTRYTVSENDNAYGDDGGGVYSFNSSSLPWMAYNNTAWTPSGSNGTSTATTCWTYGFGGSPYNSASIVPANSICVSNGTDTFGRHGFLDTNNAANLGSATLDYNLYYSPSDPTGVSTYYRWTGGTFYNNLAAFQAASGKEAHGIAATNPQLTSGGAGQTCSWTPKTQATWPPAACPTGYVLSTTASAAIGVGVDLTVSPYSLNVGTRDYYSNSIPSGHGTGYNRGADGGFPYLLKRDLEPANDNDHAPAFLDKAA